MQPIVRWLTDRSWLTASAALLMSFGFSQSTPAEEWMFRRSYYSHRVPDGMTPTYPLPESRSAYRTAYYRDGFGINTAYRINNYMIQSGGRVDRTLYREAWIEFNPPGD